MENTKQKVLNLIFELFKEHGFDFEIIEYLDLIDDLGMDSITFISFIIEVESLFDIQIPDELLLMNNFNSVSKIVEIIEQETTITND